MNAASIYVVLSAIIVVRGNLALAEQGQGGTCNACNCQFNNIQVLEQLIESMIATNLANQPGEHNSRLSRVHVLP